VMAAEGDDDGHVHHHLSDHDAEAVEARGA
jgi:hypothetical protein